MRFEIVLAGAVLVVFGGLLAYGEFLQQYDLLETKLQFAHQNEGRYWDGYKQALQDKRDLQEALDFCANELQRVTE